MHKTKKNRVSAGGVFKIIVVADLHLGFLVTIGNSIKKLHKILRDTKPDMVVFCGDTVQAPRNIYAYKKLISSIKKTAIPFASIMGNHDDDWIVSRKQLGKVLEDAPNSMFTTQPGVSGVGNYKVELVDNSGKIVYNFIFMDSNDYRTYGKLGMRYDYIHQDQIEWYKRQCVRDENYKMIPSLLFIHIPLPEYSAAYAEWKKSGFSADIGHGIFMEPCSVPYENSGMFDVIKSQNSTKYVFCGHDHLNAGVVEYEGIKLCYCIKTDKTCYANRDNIGVTQITIDTKTAKANVEFVVGE